MRHLFLSVLTICFLMVSVGTAYADDPVIYKNTTYWKNHQWQKGLAIGCVSVGGCGMIAGAYIKAIGGMAGKTDRTVSTGTTIFYTGIGLVAASIPLFVISHSNAKKAKEAVSFSLQPSSIRIVGPNGAMKSRPTVGLCMRF